MAARNVTDGVRHGQQGKTKSQSHAGKANAKLRKGGSQHSASATAENQPERAKELRSTPFP
jgi:hypothetical protein